jgi:hypothetical protein
MAHKTPSEAESKELAYNLGALFLNFGTLEHSLSRAVAAAMGLTEMQERTFVRGMFARGKVELLNAYAKKHWNDHYQKVIGKLAKQSLILIDYRNDFAHGTIMHDAEGKWSVITFRGNDRFSGKAEPVSLPLLAQRLTEAMNYAEAFERLAFDTEAGKTLRPVGTPKQPRPK